MHLAWFRAAAIDCGNSFDLIGQLIDGLRAHHTIDLIDAAGAHDIVWRLTRGHFDMVIYELEDSIASQFMWPYLVRYPGITLLRSSTMSSSRTAHLHGERRTRDLDAERTFDAHGFWPMLRAPLLASKLIATPHAAIAAMLSADQPDARIRLFAAGLDPLMPAHPGDAPGTITFGSIAPDPRQIAIIEHGIARARQAGADAQVLMDSDPRRVLRESQVLLSLRRPLNGGLLTDAVAAMASGLVPVVLETMETAGWPSLDPRTWAPRHVGGAPPVAVSLDLLDEQHSLILAIRRLAADAALRMRLGVNAHDWWRDHLTRQASIASFEDLLDEACRIPPPSHPPDWPAHFTADGTARARAILDDFGLTVDLLETSRS